MFELDDPWPACLTEKAVGSSQHSSVLLCCLHQQGGVRHRTGRVPHPHRAVQRLMHALTLLTLFCRSLFLPLAHLFHEVAVSLSCKQGFPVNSTERHSCWNGFLSAPAQLPSQLPFCSVSVFAFNRHCCQSVFVSRSVIHYWTSRDMNVC